MRPLSLPSISARSSKTSRKLSRPCTCVLFRPNRKAREIEPEKAMAIAEPTRHGRLGDVGWSAAAIAKEIQVLSNDHGELVGGA